MECALTVLFPIYSGVLVGGPALVSSVVGVKKTSKCNEAKRSWLRAGRPLGTKRESGERDERDHRGFWK